ncbi:MAG TPA: hypothetical protein VIL74_02700 [Pyrinomonadaceae bacterium]|jgi:hypothetical protein
MGILGLLFRGAREAVQEQSAKRNLEKKLGRKVSTEELYSLGSHLDAAAPNAPQMPLISTPRESTVPFGDAKPPMKTMTKLIIAAVFVLVFGVFGVAAYVATMSQSQFNRLNPFTPKPAPDDFPAAVGKFSRSSDPEYINSGYGALKEYFYSYYKAPDAPSLNLTISRFKTPEEAKAAFEEKIKQIKAEKGYQFVEDAPARFAAVWLKTGSSLVLWTEGSKIKYLSGAPQKPLYEFEGLLRNAAPAEVADVKVESSDSPAAVDGGTSVTVLQLLDDYKKDEAAADKKYKGKTIAVTGTVEVSEKDKKGSWLIGFLHPGSTLPKDGMVVCSFDKSQEASVSKVKKGDAVRLRGRVVMSLVGNVVLENCAKL